MPQNTLIQGAVPHTGLVCTALEAGSCGALQQILASGIYSLHLKLGIFLRELLTKMTSHLSLLLVFSLLPRPYVKVDLMVSTQKPNLVCKLQICNDQIYFKPDSEDISITIC